MAADSMDVDPPAAPQNAMAALMAASKAKGKEKATNGNGDVNMSDAELKALNEREGLPWVEKYRPNTLDEVVSHQDITNTSAPLPLLQLSVLTGS